MRRERPRTLYVIAPSTIECVETVRAFGMVPVEMEHHRNITCAYSLRGTLPGTPFIAKPAADWRPGPNTDALALATELQMRPLVAHGLLGLGRLASRTGAREAAVEHREACHDDRHGRPHEDVGALRGRRHGVVRRADRR